MIKFFFLSLFLLILAILFVDPLEKEEEVALFPEPSPKIEKKVATVTLEDAREIEKAHILYKKKKLGKRNSHRAMNSIKRDEPLVMESEDIEFRPLNP